MGCSSGTVVREAEVTGQTHTSTASSSTATKTQQVPAPLSHHLATSGKVTASYSAAAHPNDRQEAAGLEAQSGSAVLRVASADADVPAPPPLTPEEPLPPPVTARPPSAAARDGLTSPGGSTAVRTSSGFAEAKLAHASCGGLGDVAKSGMVLTGSTAFTSPRHCDELPFPPRTSDPTSGSSTPTPPDTILGRRSNPSMLSAYPCLNSPRPFDEAHFPPRSAGSSTSARVTTQSLGLGGLVTMAEEDILDLFDDQEVNEDQFTRVEIQGLMSKLLDDALEGATNEKPGTSSAGRQNQSLSLSTEDEQIMQEILEDLD